MKEVDSMSEILSKAIPNIMNYDAVSALQRSIATAPIVQAATPAQQVVERLKTVIDNFMASLRPDQEVAIALASFGQSHTINVESVSTLGSQLIVFSGFENGCRVQLVQHVSQLNFLLLAAPLSAPVPRRIIGFQAE